MSDEQDSKVRLSSNESARGVNVKRRWLTLVVLLAVAVTLTLTIIAAGRVNAGTNAHGVHPAAQGGDNHYANFLHDGNHNQGCDTCHQRSRDQGIVPGWPYHDSCYKCHGALVNPPDTQFCGICHTDGDVDTGNPSRKAFPTKFKERFNMKFDHAQHNQGGALPKEGCA